ncbi:MAG: DUF262 domain-containing protein [Chloroflexi bacterium]|nr:DUF262 domain-containing protein [Chloroflexota bacterium]
MENPWPDRSNNMNRFVPEQYRVADFLSWQRDNKLRLNPSFQRRAVWTDDGKSFLIETLLLGLPMPLVYTRTHIDRITQDTLREIVDGQQRIRTILEFATGKLRLNKRGGQFRNMSYEDLNDSQQEAFLGYPISVEQLIGASDNDVIDIFGRLNTYTVPLNPAEHRHAKFQGDFKHAVREMSLGLHEFWEQFKILTTRDRVRMLDDQLTAEMFGVLIDGVVDAGSRYLDNLYSRFDEDLGLANDPKNQYPASLTDATPIPSRCVEVIQYIERHLGEAIGAGFFARPPQFLMMFAAVSHLIHGIPAGKLDPLPARVSPSAVNTDRAVANLIQLGDWIDEHEPKPVVATFQRAVTGATTRLASRSVRFSYTWSALTDALKRLS